MEHLAYEWLFSISNKHLYLEWLLSRNSQHIWCQINVGSVPTDHKWLFDGPLWQSILRWIQTLLPIVKLLLPKILIYYTKQLKYSSSFYISFLYNFNQQSWKELLWIFSKSPSLTKILVCYLWISNTQKIFEILILSIRML